MNVEQYKFQVIGDTSDLRIEQIIEQSDTGIEYITLRMKNEKKPMVFPKIIIKLAIPAIDIHYKWNSKVHLNKAFNLDWFQNQHICNAFTGAPVECLLSYQNENRCTIALSDTLNTIRFQSLISEETAEYAYEIELFGTNSIAMEAYELVIRIDKRSLPYYDVLADVSAWWEQWEKNEPAHVPHLAKRAMYSTWYSFHQMLNEAVLLKQCRLSRKLGCEAVIIDDGWQTDDNNRGYAYCGDWDVASSKINDMKKFVQLVHDEKMNVLLWYSVPFVGRKSQVFERFKDMLIDPKNDREWHVLDPRYSAVREYIIGIYEKALFDWDLDGFKLDFVDEFVVTPFTGNPVDTRRDYSSVSAAVDRLLKDCIRRLKAIKPDIMLEFRQTYNGPMMRTYGNIIRAVDCPLDDLENRVRITDIRLIAGNTAVHSDMVMWNPEDTVESAAMQMVNIMFSVPQISLLIDQLSVEHQQMLEFYCSIWNEYRDAFINGRFMPLNPHCRYNVLTGLFEDTFVCSYHSHEMIAIDQIYTKMIFINGTYSEMLHLWNACEDTTKRVTVYDCMGQVLTEQDMVIHTGYNRIDVLPCSIIRVN